MSVSFFPQTIQLALKMLIEFRIRPNLRALQHSSDSLPSPHASRISLLVSAEDFIAGYAHFMLTGKKVLGVGGR